MHRVVTLRLSDDEYHRILMASQYDHRPISNFITTVTLKQIEESHFADAVEMAEIKSNKKLMNKLKSGHKDAKTLKGKFVG